MWRKLDETLWAHTQNPWLLLQHVPAARLAQLSIDPEFLRDVRALEEARARYRATPPWRPRAAARLPRVAYFSMEFGLHDGLPLYAGGLGVLAGDMLKTASDLDVPVVGIGILWQQGYFRQVLDAVGRQTELYPFNEPASLPVQPVVDASGDRLRIALDLPGRSILLRVWQVTVGRTRLYLLDSNDAYNAAPDRGLTSALYGGSTDVRLMQEVILGIAGWRLVEALGLEVDLCHLNEGHAAFVVLERARQFMVRHQVTFDEAWWATRAGNVFTTHTAVPAGFDRFTMEDVTRYQAFFAQYVQTLGVSWTDLLALGQATPGSGEPFNMAWLATRGSAWVNGVSQLHGHVSRRLFGGLFPRRPVDEVPVGHITNGVHVPSWDSPWTDELCTRAAGKERWRGDVSALTTHLLQATDEELWGLRQRETDDLVRYARERLGRKLARHGRVEEAHRIAGGVLRSDALTLGFARRFATYKRPNLLLADPERLLRLLSDPARPVQLIVAGKAHPKDEDGKRMIEEWARFATRPEARAAVVFLDDYDLRLATEMVQGVDVWLNTPRRPWEASGTSGMKVLVNGGLNLSTLDGWWAEAYAPDLGWAVGDRDDRQIPEEDARDADQVYALLERTIVPEFYDRDAGGLPRRWLARIRASMASLTPRFSSVRMLQEYTEQVYLPAAAQQAQRAAGDRAAARELAAWARHLQAHWPAIRFGHPEAFTSGHQVTISVPVDLGAIEAHAVRVELYAGADGGEPAVVRPMAPTAPPDSSGAVVYGATVDTTRPASHFTPRVVPYHRDARLPIELPLIAWQR